MKNPFFAIIVMAFFAAFLWETFDGNIVASSSDVVSVSPRSNMPEQSSKDRLSLVKNPSETDFLWIPSENRISSGLGVPTTVQSRHSFASDVEAVRNKIQRFLFSFVSFRQSLDASSTDCPLFLILLTLRN